MDGRKLIRFAFWKKIDPLERAAEPSCWIGS